MHDHLKILLLNHAIHSQRKKSNKLAALIALSEISEPLALSRMFLPFAFTSPRIFKAERKIFARWRYWLCSSPAATQRYTEWTPEWPMKLPRGYQMKDDLTLPIFNYRHRPTALRSLRIRLRRIFNYKFTKKNAGVVLEGGDGLQNHFFNFRAM